MSKDSYWFKHDANARDDLKLLKIKRIHSHWGIGIYWEVIEVLRCQSDYKHSIKDTDLQFLCEDLLRCKDFNKFKTWLHDCLNMQPKPLFNCDDNFFWSDSLLDRMEKWDVKKDNGSKGGRGRKANGKLNESETKANQKHKIREDKIIEDIYTLYPSKCLISGRSTGKSSKDKKKIARLLDDGKELELIIKKYLQDCEQSKTYLKNFSTLLNNLPDYGELEKKAEPDRKKYITYDDMIKEGWQK